MSKKVNPFYVSKEWRELRHKILKRDGYRCAMCQVKCLGKKRGKPSPHVDHIEPLKDNPRRALDPSNLRTLCAPCHSRHTKHMQQDKPEIGLDGYPVDM